LGLVAFCDQLATGCVSLLQLFGLALLIAGALSYANIDKVDYFMEKAKNEVNFSASPIALMVVGSIIFVIAFYGCCGAIRESHCMIVTVSCTLHNEFIFYTSYCGKLITYVWGYTCV